MSQLVAAEDAIDRAQRWQRLDTEVFQFPEDRLSATEQVLI
jgi:hypothetical protein